MIVANDITAAEGGFGAEDNKVLIIDKNGQVEDLPLLSKSEVAHKILDRVVGILAEA